MTSAWPILFGASLTLVTMLCLGALAWRGESVFLRLVCGAAVLSPIVFAMSLVGLIAPFPFLVLGICAVAASWRFWRRKALRFSPWLLVYLPFFVYFAVNAMAPEVSPDGTSYHNALIARFAAGQRFIPYTDSLYAALPQGAEMIYLMAFVFGAHSAAALAHFCFLALIPLGFAEYGRRMGRPAAGVFAGLLFFVTPIAAKTGVSAYVDVALAAVLLGMTLVVEQYLESGKRRELAIAGVLAGTAYNIKMTGGAGLVVVLAILFFYAGNWRRDASLVVGCFAVTVAPWWIKNAIVYGNPLAPFANELFANPYFPVDRMLGYAEALRHFNGVAFGEIPRQLLWDGFLLGGLLGPFYLLAPLAFLAWRGPVCRRLSIAAAVFLALYPLNTGARFLIPALPFLLLNLTQFPRILFVAGALHIGLSWPTIVPLYAHANTWRVYEFPWKEAWRRRPEADFLRLRMGDYEPGRYLDAQVPAGELVYVMPSIQRAYHSREVVVAYEGAKGSRAEFALSVPLNTAYEPTWRHRFTVAGTTSSLEIVETGRQTKDRDNFSIAEIHLLTKSGEIAVPAGSVAMASHGEWDARLAIDQNPTTRWSTNQPFAPGMWWRIVFPKPLEIERVDVDLTHDQWAARLLLKIDHEDGKPVAGDIAAPANLRRWAIDAVRREGIRWLFLGAEEALAKDLETHKQDWPVTRTGQSSSYVLYRVDRE